MNPARPFVLRLLDTLSLATFATAPFAALHFVLLCRPDRLFSGDSFLPVVAVVLVLIFTFLWRIANVLVKIQRALIVGGTGYFLMVLVAPIMRHPVVARTIADRLEAGAPYVAPLFREGAGMMALAVIGLFWFMFCVLGFLFTRLLRSESEAPPSA